MRNLLTSEPIARFHEQGFLVIRKMVDPQQCAQMKSVALEQLQQAQPPLEYEADVGYAGAPASLESEGGRTVRRLRGAFDRDVCFRDWATAPHLVDMLHHAGASQLHHDQAPAVRHRDRLASRYPLLVV
jgi:phytanoyl-CoA hydroxylase